MPSNNKKPSKPVAANKTGTSSKSAGKAPEDVSSSIPLDLQQHILNVFRDACAEPLGSELEPVLQQVKGHLYNRDFIAAFGTEENLEAYATRWSPSRALGYLEIFNDISDTVAQSIRHESDNPQHSSFGTTRDDLPEVSVENLRLTETELERAGAAGSASATGNKDEADDSDSSSIIEITREDAEADKPPAYEEDKTVPDYEHPPSYGADNGPPTSATQTSRPGLRMACIGGGAGAELVATAGWLKLQADNEAEDDDPIIGEAPVDLNSVEIHCVDIAEWSSVVHKLETAITTPPTISKYASAAAKAANKALLPAGAMKIESVQQDVLDANVDCLRSIFQSSDLITMMFTLNELYSTSVSKTQRLLFELTVSTRPGTLLLVVDSPGSYSTVTINGAEKKYPMQWLLDHTLLEASKKTRVLPPGDHWEKLLSDESRWFRLPKGLEYPIELENMRYQIHLYRRNEVREEPREQRRGARATRETGTPLDREAIAAEELAQRMMDRHWAEPPASRRPLRSCLSQRWEPRESGEPTESRKE